MGGRRIGDEKLKSRVIGEAAERLAGLAKDTRNLIHPGKALRSGQIVQQNNGCPYRKPHPASEQTANRVMFVPDDRFSHVAGMRADQALPIEGTA